MERKFNAIKAGHFNAGEVRDRRPSRPRTWEENDGRAPDTVGALAAASTQPETPETARPSGTPLVPPTPPPAPPPAAITYSSKLLKSYQWDPPNSCFFDNGLELWFRAFSRWSDEEQAEFLTSLPPKSSLASFFFHFQRRLRWIASTSGTDIQGDRELGLGQSVARHAIFNRWQLYPNKDDYGCATTWIHHALRDSDPPIDVRLQFGVAHIFYGECPSHHPARIGVGNIQDFLRINLFDLRTSRRKCGSAASLTDYFANCTPRIVPGNDEGGTTVVHSLPAPICNHPDCAGSQLLGVKAIETLWPKILHINPESGTHPRLPVALSFSIDDGAGSRITYELVGTISFDAPRKHWTSKLLIGDTTFNYDDLIHVPYHCTSEVATSSKPLQAIISEYDEEFQIDTALPRRSPSQIDDTPPPESPKIPPTSTSGAADFPIDLSEPPTQGAHLPEIPPPAEWCRWCRLICDHAFGKEMTVQCGDCKFWYHVNCVSKADWIIDPECLEDWMCASCDEALLPPVAIWTNELIGEYLLFKTNPNSCFYPARIEGLTQTGDDNVGMIKWPVRLTKDARELWSYENPEISEALLRSCQAIIDIITGSPSASHPIGPDYEQWMANGGELKDIGRANDFVTKFYSADILPGDASLIEPHTDYVLRSIPPDIPATIDAPAALSEGLRRRATILASILFQLVILRIYLRRSSADDAQIYFLARSFDPKEHTKIFPDDPMYLAKTGKITRHLTEPKIVLQTAQESTDQRIPPRWCKIGIRVAKAAAARIPPRFILATGYNRAGGEYVWLGGEIKPYSMDLDGEDVKPRPSSPLSEPPIETLPVDPQPSPSPGPPTAQQAGVSELLKRKYHEPLGPGGPDSMQSGADQAVEGPPLRRSTRRR
ncbi:hypothetical protein FB451DRAFT_1557372 [Mycena latifolia]|nr:hypothetical protein FB451DRAFT_1557372 [Mycena latifolia]